jgi:hypothetical protein
LGCPGNPSEVTLKNSEELMDGASEKSSEELIFKENPHGK